MIVPGVAETLCAPLPGTGDPLHGGRCGSLTGTGVSLSSPTELGSPSALKEKMPLADSDVMFARKFRAGYEPGYGPGSFNFASQCKYIKFILNLSKKTGNPHVKF